MVSSDDQLVIEIRHAMPMQQTTNGAPPSVVSPPGKDEEQVRKLAVAQIEGKRRFHTRAFGAAALTVVLVIVWAIAEYNNADGRSGAKWTVCAARTTAAEEARRWLRM
jgi:hypothetical protein